MNMPFRWAPARPRPIITLVAALGAGHACGGGDPDLVMVASGFGDQVIVLEAQTGAVVDSVALDPRRGETDEPHALALAPDGQHWYATVSHGEPTLWKFERVSNRLVGRVKLGTAGAGRIGTSPDGSVAYVPDYYRDGGDLGGEVAVVRLEDLAVVDRWRLCRGPHDAQASPDGTMVAVACALADEVVIVSAEDGSVLTRVLAGPDPGIPGQPKYRPLNLVWSATGQEIFVSLHVSGELAIWSYDGSEVARLPLPAGPAQLAWVAGLLVVPNRNSGSVSIVDPNTLSVAVVELSVPHPHGVDGSDDGRAFVSYEGDTQSPGGVVALTVPDGEVVWRTEAGNYNLGILYLGR